MSESCYRQRLMSEFQRLMNESKDASLISHPVLKGKFENKDLKINSTNFTRWMGY